MVVEGEDYCVVESLQDYEMLNTELDQSRATGRDLEQQRCDLERRVRDLTVENSNLRVALGTEKITVRQLQDEIDMQREEMRELRRAASSEPADEAPPHIESPRDLLRRMRGGGRTPPPPPPPDLPPLPETPDKNLSRPGLRLRKPRVLYANPGRWSSQ